MSREPIADLNLFAVSANLKETAINTEQTLDTTFAVPKTFVVNVTPKRATNKDKANNKETADTVYDLGSELAYELPFDEMAEAQHMAFLLNYHLGSRSTAAWGTGYKHTFTKSASKTLPGFTSGYRAANAIQKERFASQYVDTIKATFGRNDWFKVSGGIKGTGKKTDSLVEESITAAYNAASLTLAANGVQGGTAALRLDNVHQVRVQVPATLEWVEVAFSVVSAATPAIITITAPGGVGTSTTYKVLYVPTEAAWCTFPARVVEPPLRCANLDIKLGGKWNGTTFLGGRSIGTDLKSLDWTSSRKMVLEPRPVTGFSGAYANFAEAGGIEQKLTLDKEMRDFVVQNLLGKVEYFGVRAYLLGAEFETGKTYLVDLVWPRCAFVNQQKSVDGVVVAEKGDIEVLEDDTYGTIWAMVANKVAAYGA